MTWGGDLEQFKNRGLDKTVTRAVSMAGSDALRALRADTNRYVRARKQFPLKTLEKSIRMNFPKMRHIYDGVWTMRVRGEPMPLGAFKFRQGKKGVYVTINKGNRRLIRGAFVARMRSGHVGVFARAGKGRLPINEMFTSRLTDLFKDSEFQANMWTRPGYVFNRTFNRVFKALMMKKITKGVELGE